MAPGIEHTRVQPRFYEQVLDGCRTMLFARPDNQLSSGFGVIACPVMHERYAVPGAKRLQIEFGHSRPYAPGQAHTAEILKKRVGYLIARQGPSQHAHVE